MSTLTRQNILSIIKSEGVRFIDLWFTDIIGIVKSVTIPATEIENVLDNGSHFDGSSIEGFARVAESDMVLWPDLNTFAILPWTPADERVARLICTVYTPTGEPFIGDPRTALIRNLQQAEAEGYTFKTGMELEFFLFPRDAQGKPIICPPADDYAAYFDMSPEKIQSIRRKMLATLAEMGIKADSVHSEIGYGQHEIDFQYSDALDTADNILTARIVIRTIARQHGLHCTFMPRPSNEFPGSGMHTHQSLHDPATGENVFVDTSDEYNLSITARRFLAGQLAHARAMCAILAPLVNSYKRLGTSFEAPTNVTWAHVNRAALIRVPSTAPGKESHTRLELRCPDPSANPYLAMLVMLAGGMDGIHNETSLAEPLEESVVPRGRPRRIAVLPTSLGEALEALREDDVIMNALGPYISDRYLEAKRQEFAAYSRQVTSWELDNYLSRF